MLLFKRIFKFEKAKVEQLEKRHNLRYVPGRGFPLRVTLHFGGRDYSAKILNLSGQGIGVLVKEKPDLPAGHHLRADLQLEQHRLELKARIAHVERTDGGFVLGLGFVFEDFDAQKSYMQLLQPVVIGQSLQPMAIDRVVQDDPQFFKRIFVGESDSLLTIRLALSPVDPLHSFELRMLDYFCRGSMDDGTSQTYALESRDATEDTTGQPVFEASGGTHEEIRQLFRWILPNISEAVPDDFRAFLQRFVG